jgi:hypothetical protein
VFTVRYALSPYIKQIRFVFKGLKNIDQELRISSRNHKVVKKGGIDEYRVRDMGQETNKGTLSWYQLPHIWGDTYQTIRSTQNALVTHMTLISTIT